METASVISNSRSKCLAPDPQANFHPKSKMANLALNITVRWHVLIALLLILSVAVLFLYSSSWKGWADSPNKANDDTSQSQDENEQQGYLSWDGTEKGVFYRRVMPESTQVPVLFLHGAAFTSKNWHDIGTLSALGSKGYPAVAVDLPGHGESQNIKAPDSIQFLSQLIKELGLERPVVVAPSMSGSYALPFVMNKEHVKELRGFIPVAPGEVAKYTEEELKGLDLPTLIVYGEKDAGFKQYAEKMNNIPGSEVFTMKGARHACYLDNPEEFNARVIEFLDKLD